MRNIPVWLICLLALALFGCGGATETAEAPAEEPAAETSHQPAEVADAQPLDVAALKEKIDAGADVFIVDVRTQEELDETGIIPGAVHIPIDEFEGRISEVPTDKPIVTYCMRGGRASRAAATLRENGYTQPIEYGGITEWKEAGYEVAQPEGE